LTPSSSTPPDRHGDRRGAADNGLARASISDIADRFGYGILPLVSYVAMLAAAGLVISRAALAPISWPQRCSFYSQSTSAMRGT